MKQRSGKTMKSLVGALAAAAITVPVAQAGVQARSERSEVARPAGSYYSSPAFYAELMRVGAMNGSYSKHPSTSKVARPAGSYYSSPAFYAELVRVGAMDNSYSKHPGTSKVARPAASYYSSPAFYAELVRVGAMDNSYSKHPGTSKVARPAASFYSSQAYHALLVRSAAMNAFYSKHPGTSVGRPDDRAGVHGPGLIGTPQVVTTSGDGFDWGDASVGAGVAFGALIVLTCGVALSRRNRTAPLAV